MLSLQEGIWALLLPICPNETVQLIPRQSKEMVFYAHALHFT
jgi:hypothetical protein